MLRHVARLRCSFVSANIGQYRAVGGQLVGSYGRESSPKFGVTVRFGPI
jgi:hypothetical protein